MLHCDFHHFLDALGGRNPAEIKVAKTKIMEL